MSTTPDIYDTVVVGAGLTGALVAHHLAAASLNVVVLEAKEAPGGVAGRGMGLALLGTPEPYVTLQTRLGVDKGRQAWELTRQNLDLLTAVLHKQHQEATHVGSFRMTNDTTEAGLLQESAVLLRQDLYAAEMDDAGDYGYTVGMRTADDLAFDPTALVAALLDHPNITVEYDTEVQAIHPYTGRATEAAILSVWAHKHYIQTKQVVLANGLHAIRLHRGLADVLHSLPMHAIDFRGGGVLPTPLIVQQGKVVVHARGRDWRMAGWADDQQDALSVLTGVAQQLCPDAPVVERHSWWVAESADGLPIVGEVPGAPNVYTVNGLGPWGLSWVCVAVDRLIGLLVHGEDVGLLTTKRLFAA